MYTFCTLKMFSEENLHNFGTPLPTLELDQVPSKKPLYVQDQIATDDQGRRRFHGAFTGGFSAGYWNTVGSKEGWTPQSFKSSRTEKAVEKLLQKPEDFMDDEDRGEFGIAPRSIKINEDFTSVTAAAEPTELRKRKFMQIEMQPIPGEPVLQQLIRTIKDKAAVRILKTWGWRPGQGIGPRQTKREKKKARERNKKELYLMEKYGCEIPTTSNKHDDEEEEDGDSEEDEESEDEITFAPEDCELPPQYIKQDRYGIGYVDNLSRQSVLGGSVQTEHINLFQSLEAVGKQNQKISFTGQAFGVGAFEEDDDDLYAGDDMTRYDFSLEDKKKKRIKQKTNDLEDLIFGDFILDREPTKLPLYKVEMPFGWQPRNWYEKRSRFEPIDPRKQRHIEQIFATTLQEKEMTREKRAQLLGEEELKTTTTTQELNITVPEVAKEKPAEIKTKTIEALQKEYKERNEKTKNLIEKITAKSSSFTKGGIITIEGEEKPTGPENISTTFKPFAANEKKQQRYEQFLCKEFKCEQEIEEFLQTIQPLGLSQWDRQMELKEFQQAKKLYKPLKGIMSDRFITESEVQAVEVENKKQENKQIVVERSKHLWKPHSLLCKRYNIAEPFKGLLADDKKSKTKQKKLTVFDYLETSINRKEDFQTPVIIPKHIEKPLEIRAPTSRALEDKEKEKEVQTSALEWQEVLKPSDNGRSKDKKSFAFKPKTELEKQVIESINKPLPEKKELFKAIFSDSESDGNEEEEKTKSAEAVNDLSKPLNAAAANLLRNNSPPRGIFKALFTSSTNKSKNNDQIDPNKQDSTSMAKEPNKVIFKSKSDRELNQQTNELQSPDVYGPALPQHFTNKSYEINSNKSSLLDEKLANLLNKHKTTRTQVSEEKWLEKGGVNMDTSDTEDSSESQDSDASAGSEKSIRESKKKSKKSKKKKLSQHKHNNNKKKHKERNHKSGQKSKKHDKKKKKKKHKKK